MEESLEATLSDQPVSKLPILEEFVPVSESKMGRINETVLLEALAAGLSPSEAGRLAGSKAVNPTPTVKSYIENASDDFKITLKSKLEEKVTMLLKHINDEKAEDASLGEVAKTLDIVLKNKNIVEGNATEGLQVVIVGAVKNYQINRYEGGNRETSGVSR